MRGQIFSLDFIIAMTIVVLAMGMLLNFYEISSYQSKEINLKNELNLVALNASHQMLQQNKCTLRNNFETQGYKFYGCSNTGNFSGNRWKNSCEW